MTAIRLIRLPPKKKVLKVDVRGFFPRKIIENLLFLENDVDGLETLAQSSR
jgi:hypothetical protein